MANRRLILSRRADADIDRLAAFIARENPRAAQRAIARLVFGMNLLAAHPELGVEIGSGIRQLHVRHGRKGYVVRYRITEDMILVTRIWHGAEDRETP